ncbi:hypothetical protein ACWGH2_24870 [Streptomyces sp. NPDC054871]
MRDGDDVPGVVGEFGEHEQASTNQQASLHRFRARGIHSAVELDERATSFLADG